MRRFGGDRMKNMLSSFNLPADQQIKSRMVTNSLESAQKRIEGHNFDVRKQILAYDDVINAQRKVVYERRQKLLTDSDKEVETVLNEVMDFMPDSVDAIKTKQAEFAVDKWLPLMRRLILQVIDTLWVEHLEVMEYTRSSVNLRAYGQRDPLTEYKKEGTRLFKELQDTVLARLAEAIPRLDIKIIEHEEEQLRKQQRATALSGGSETAHTAAPKNEVGKKNYGRNDLVTVTNGTDTKKMKYKKAELLIADGSWRIVS